MPNWYEGNIRVRGTNEQVARFFTSELYTEVPKTICDAVITEFGNLPIITEMKFGDMMIRKSRRASEFLFKDTERCMITKKVIALNLNTPEDDGIIKTHCVDGFRVAGQIDVETFAKKVRKYGVDIRIDVYNQGYEHRQRVTMLKEGHTRREEFDYGDWYWECPCPNLGG